MCKKCVAKLRKITKKPFAFILHDNRCDVQKNKKCIKKKNFLHRKFFFFLRKTIETYMGERKKNKNKIIKNPGFLRFSIADSREI